MDKKKIKVPKKEEQELQERLKKDFVVRNMPAFTSLSGASYEGKTEKGRVGKTKKSNGLGSAPDNKHQSTGMIIISAGLIVVAGLFYAAYHFLILPAMQVSTSVDQASTQMTKPVVTSEENAQTVTIIPDPVVTPVVNEEPATSSEPISTELSLPIVADADNDGLSDVAELFLGTNPQLADTDNDTYSDKQELLAGYNPAGAGKLSENSNLALYSDSNGFFAVIYPQAWTVDAANQNAVLFSAPDQSFIQISREESDQEYNDVLAWYRQQFSDADSLDASRFLESNFGTGIISADQQIVYFLDADHRHILVISYIKSGEAAPYMEIFKMMASTLMHL